MAISYSKIEQLLGSSWAQELAVEFDKPYMNRLLYNLKNERAKYVVYPEQKDVFNAYLLTPLDSVKVVIIGQDPYHTPNHAHGLAFSVPETLDTTIPPSLKNILIEVGKDMGKEAEPFRTDLTRWAKQGVFLLNTALTVRKGQPGSHAHIGWNDFIIATIKAIAERFFPTVFMLWGKHAQQFKNIITVFGGQDFHYILEASHPSPFSYHLSFKDCNHFIKANEFLRNNYQDCVEW